MEEPENTMNSRENGSLEASHNINQPGQQMNQDQELVYRLKSAIDQRGRYSFRLNDMAAGFAAGQGVSNAEARRSIEDKFTAQLGQSPQEYLDQHYEHRRQNGRDGQVHEHSHDRGRGR